MNSTYVSRCCRRRKQHPIAVVVQIAITAGMLCEAVLSFGCVRSERNTGPPPSASQGKSGGDKSQSAQSNQTAKQRDAAGVVTTHWTTCPSLESVNLRLCSDVGSQAPKDVTVTNACPKDAVTALIVDDDSVTRQAGKWEFLQ